ncbi:hypothetical protein C6P40_004721, partial [Pichia californica]
RLPSKIKQYILNKPDCMNYIFDPPPSIILMDPIDGYNEYVKSIHRKNHRINYLLQFYPPYKESLQQSQTALLDQTYQYKILNQRFKQQHQSDSVIPDEQIQEANHFYSNLFDQPAQSISENDDAAEQLVNTLNETLTPEEKSMLEAPITESELHNNLIKLHAKGPSAPGYDQITYANWVQMWPKAKLVVTKIAQ